MSVISSLVRPKIIQPSPDPTKRPVSCWMSHSPPAALSPSLHQVNKLNYDYSSIPAVFPCEQTSGPILKRHPFHPINFFIAASNRMSFAHWFFWSRTMFLSSAIRRNEVLKHAPTWVNLENVMLSERGQTQKATHCMTVFKRSVQNRWIQRQKIFVIARGWWEAGVRSDC